MIDLGMTYMREMIAAIERTKQGLDDLLANLQAEMAALTVSNTSAMEHRMKIFDAHLSEFQGDEIKVPLHPDVSAVKPDKPELGDKDTPKRESDNNFDKRFYIETRGGYFVVQDTQNPYRLKEKHPNHDDAYLELRSLKLKSILDHPRLTPEEH